MQLSACRRRCDQRVGGVCCPLFRSVAWCSPFDFGSSAEAFASALEGAFLLQKRSWFVTAHPRCIPATTTCQSLLTAPATIRAVIRQHTLSSRSQTSTSRCLVLQSTGKAFCAATEPAVLPDPAHLHGAISRCTCCTHLASACKHIRVFPTMTQERVPATPRLLRRLPVPGRDVRCHHCTACTGAYSNRSSPACSVPPPLYAAASAAPRPPPWPQRPLQRRQQTCSGGQSSWAWSWSRCTRISACK